jgi:hypothetical protein
MRPGEDILPALRLEIARLLAAALAACPRVFSKASLHEKRCSWGLW